MTKFNLGNLDLNVNFTFQNSGEFGKGEDGSEYYCRWCGQGGEVFCCASCPCVFCTKCIKANLDAKYVREIEKNDDWECFICDKGILRKHRAEHWALRNFMIKQLEKIRKITVSSEEELNVLLNEDVSTCCPHRKKKVVAPVVLPKKTLTPPVPSYQLTSQKRRSATPPQQFSAPKKIAPNPGALRPVKHNVYTYTAASSTGTPNPQPTRSAFINSSQKQTTNTNQSKKNDEIVCTPDLPGFFGSDESLVSPPKADPPPLAPMRGAAPTTQRNPTTMLLNGTAVPIFHNVNGFQIDLNHAARQDVYRLPNGKLIQVRKTNPPTQVPNNYRPLRPPHSVLRNLAPANLPINGNAMGVRRPQIGPNIRVQHANIRPQMPRPGVNNQVAARFTVSHEGRIVATPTFSMINAAQPVRPVVAPQSQSSMFTQQNGSISVARATYPKTPFGIARNEFEDRIISAMEICQHTINKMITLTNSTSFKTANNFKDLKDLYTHLQYLFTYTTGKLTNFNESLKTSIESLVKKDLSTKEKTDIDELQIVDQKVDVIDVLSDDEDGTEEQTKLNNDESVVKHQSPVKSIFPTINIQEKEIPSINEDDLKNETVKEIVENDKRLKTQVVVKMEKIEDSKSSVVQNLLKAHRERVQAKESEEFSDDAESEKEQTDDVAVAENEIEKTSADDVPLDIVNDKNKTIAENDNLEEENVDKSDKVSDNTEIQESSEPCPVDKESVSDPVDVIPLVELSSDDEEFEVDTRVSDKPADSVDNSLEGSNKENIDDHLEAVEFPEDKILENSKDSTTVETVNMEIDCELPAELMDVDEEEFILEKDEKIENISESQEKEDVEKVETAETDIVEPTNDSSNVNESLDILDPISQDGSLDDILNSSEPCEKIDLDGFLEGLNKITEGGDKSKTSINPS